MSAKILVTGGAGYIGSQTCKVLKQKGYTPVVLDNLCRGHSKNIKWGPLVKVSLSESERIAHTLMSEKIDAVIHFAAYAYVGESMENPAMYYENNFAGTLSLLKAMEKADVKKLVFSSSCATYGLPSSETISEDHEQKPINPYGRSKLMAEQMINNLCKAGTLRAVCPRYFNAAGADSDLEIGEEHEPETHLIPLAIRAALSGEKFKIFGNDYPTPDGTCIRDFIHVQDLATAHVKALEYLNSHDGFHPLNLGTGRGYSVLEVLKCIESMTQKKIVTEVSGRRPGDPPRLVANCEKAHSMLQWKPEHSDLEKLIKSALAWEQKA